MPLHIFMVDDEADLVWSADRQLRRERPDLVFEGFTSPRAVLERLRSVEPDVLITDVRMPGMSGLELLLEVRALAPELPVIIITAFGLPEVMETIRGRSGVDFLEKPFRFETLLAAIDRLTRNKASGFSGAVSLAMLPDLIQLFTLSSSTGILDIRRGNQQGQIAFERGQIVHAECGALEGEEAVFELMRWQGGAFQLRAGTLPPRRTITASWQEVLLEGCRRLDEERRPAEAETLDPLAAAQPAAVADGGYELETPPSLALPATVISFDLDAADGRGGTGAVDPTDVAALIPVLERLAGASSRYVVELLDESFGIAIGIYPPAARSVVLGNDLPDRQTAARFRAQAARLMDAVPTAPAALVES